MARSTRPRSSDSATQSALAQARQAGVRESALLDMEDDYVVRPGKMSTPGAARAYWEAAISKLDSLNLGAVFSGLSGLAHAIREKLNEVAGGKFL
jgi:hypothetical protein